METDAGEPDMLDSLASPDCISMGSLQCGETNEQSCGAQEETILRSAHCDGFLAEKQMFH